MIGGVEEDSIIAEVRSNNTWENAVNTCSVLKDVGYRRIILVTSAVHMRRAVYSFKHSWEYEIIPAPCDYLRGSDVNVLDFLPNRSSLDSCLRALHEWVGLLWYGVKVMKMAGEIVILNFRERYGRVKLNIIG